MPRSQFYKIFSCLPLSRQFEKQIFSSKSDPSFQKIKNFPPYTWQIFEKKMCNLNFVEILHAISNQLLITLIFYLHTTNYMTTKGKLNNKVNTYLATYVSHALLSSSLQLIVGFVSKMKRSIASNPQIYYNYNTQLTRRRPLTPFCLLTLIKEIFTTLRSIPAASFLFKQVAFQSIQSPINNYIMLYINQKLHNYSSVTPKLLIFHVCYNVDNWIGQRNHDLQSFQFFFLFHQGYTTNAFVMNIYSLFCSFSAFLCQFL